jgi:GxxExxY protein
VENKVVLEIKAVKELTDIDRAQLMSYLKASKIEIGLLLNFAQKSLGIKRIIYSSDKK